MQDHKVLSIVIILAIYTSISFFVNAQNPETITVVFTQDISLRDLAQEHLGNPNEWEALLHYNGFESLADMRPNTTLTIPVTLFQNMAQALQHTAETARLANMEGAGILATGFIDEANRLYDQAIDLKNQGQLEQADQTAREALEWAGKALIEAKEKKVQAVSAILDQKTGTVESRTPDEPVWNDTPLKGELIEQERVRTLAASLAGILFVDGSQISLNEDSLAVIGAMKANQIKRSFQAEVTVLEGDILAHLSALGGKKEFTINTPGVETTIRSRKFRTTRDEAHVTRIANYDGEIDVAANQRMVTLRKNEGTKIEEGRQPEDPRKLLMPPVVLSPSANATLFTAAVEFGWEARELARAYQVDISADWKFSTITHQARVTGTRYQWQAPHKGVYYYRIYAIDNDDFSGPYSDPVGFYIDLDTQPPYLSVKTPDDGAIVLLPELEIQGTVEQSATLTINDLPVEYDETGAFAHPVTLTPGERVVTIAATDAARNTTSIQRRIIYNTTTQLITLTTPSEMIINTPQVTLKGTLRPGTQVRINGQPTALPEHFEQVLTVPEGEHTVTITGIAPEGGEQTITLRITVDLTPPELTVESAPAATRDPNFTITGTVSEPVDLSIDGAGIGKFEQAFNLPVTLQEGPNSFVLEAIDRVGNTATSTIRTVLDTTPPTITAVACAPTETQGGEIVTCEVNADDAGVGLAKTGSLTLVITPGGQLVNGVLTFNRNKGEFEGSVFIPADVAGTVSIHSLSIQDRLKNEAAKF